MSRLLASEEQSAAFLILYQELMQAILDFGTTIKKEGAWERIDVPRVCSAVTALVCARMADVEYDMSPAQLVDFLRNGVPWEAVVQEVRKNKMGPAAEELSNAIGYARTLEDEDDG